jgi:hypothetical protein
VLQVSPQTLFHLLAMLRLLAILLIVAGGFAFMLQARKIGGRAVLAGIGVAVATALAGNAVAGGFSVSILDAITAVCGLLAVAAWAFGLRRPAYVLGIIAVGHWIIWPAIFAFASLFPLWLVLVVLLPTGVFIGIWLLQHMVELWYGEDAGAHVAGEYLIRTFDAIGRGLRYVLTLRFLR